MKSTDVRQVPFMFASLFQVYTSFTILRSFCDSTWLQDGKPVDGITPTSLRSLRAAEFALLISAYIASLLCLAAIVIRLCERFLRLAGLFCIFACGYQALSLCGAIVLVKESSKGTWVPENFSQGLLAAFLSMIVSGVETALFVADAMVNRCFSCTVSMGRRKLILSSILIVWVLTISGLVMAKVEGWTFQLGFTFAIETLLTIGYGHASPVTTFGRIFLYISFLFGMGVFGFFVNSVSESIGAKAKAGALRMAKLRQRRYARMRASYDVLVRISRRRKSGALMNAPNSALTELPVSSERGTPMSDSAETVIHVDEDVDEVAVSAEEVDQKIEEIEEEIEEEIREEIREVANVVGESVEEEVDAERAGFDRDSDTSTSIKAGSVGNHSRGSSTRKVDIKSLERLQERHKFWLIVLLVLGWWLVSAYIFHLTEPTWSYSDACYFAFVTLATIGFGDFIPSNPWSWEFWNIFVMSGIAIFAFFISTVVETYGRHFVASAALVERNIRSRAERAELERAKKRTGGRRREKKAEKGTV